MSENAQTQDEKQFPTDLLWAISHETASQKNHKVSVVVDLLYKMYPGINYWHTQVTDVAYNIAAVDLDKQMNDRFGSTLKAFKTEEEAIAKLGETVTLEEVKKCAGYDWINWKDDYKKAKQTAKSQDNKIS